MVVTFSHSARSRCPLARYPCGVFAFFGGCLGFGAGLVLGLVVSLKVTLHFAINVVVSVDVSDLDEVDEELDEELDDEEELSEVRAPLLDEAALSTDVRVLSRSLGAKSSSVSSWSWLGVVLGSGGAGGVSSRWITWFWRGGLSVRLQ